MIAKETSGHTYTVENGIVHLYVKPEPPSIQALKEATEALRVYKERTGSLWILIDPRDAIALNGEQRRYASRGLNNIADGVAMINNNVFVRFTHKLIIKFDAPPFPVEVFPTKEEAATWLTKLAAGE